MIEPGADERTPSSAPAEARRKKRPLTLWGKVRRVLFSVIRIVLAVYVIVALFIFLLQPKLVFAPHREIERTPAEDGMPFEDVELLTDDDVQLHGWWVPAPAPDGGSEAARGSVLFCHGNAGNISHRTESVGVFHRLGLNVLIFDYRGYGKSAGRPTEKGTYLDAEAAWRHLVEVRGARPERLVVFGRSLGGAVAARTAEAHPPGLLILESTFTSLPDMGAELYPWLPVRLLSRYRYRSIDRIRGMKCPVLVIHSPEDDLVPYAHGRRLFEAAPGPKAFLEISGDHNNGWYESRDRYVAGLRAFLDEHLPSAP